MLNQDMAQAVDRWKIELAGYHLLHFAKVQKVNQVPGLHTKSIPLATVDLQLLDDQLKPLINKLGLPLDDFRMVPLARFSRHLSDPPSKGDTVLVAFVNGLASSAVVLAVLHDKQTVLQKEGVLELSGADQIKIGASLTTMDNAVLFKPLEAIINALADAVDALGQAGNLGGPLPGYPVMLEKLITVKAQLLLLKSEVQLGELTKLPLP